LIAAIGILKMAAAEARAYTSLIQPAATFVSPPGASSFVAANVPHRVPPQSAAAMASSSSPFWPSGHLAFGAPLAVATFLWARRRAPRLARHPTHARSRLYCRKRPRVDPDAVNFLDESVIARETVPGIHLVPIWQDGPTHADKGAEDNSYAVEEDDPEKWSGEGPAPTTKTEDGEDIVDLYQMNTVARADVIDSLTRKAFVLLEAGEYKEAKEQFDQVNRIVDLFQRLVAADLPEQKPKKKRVSDAEYFHVKSDQIVLMRLQAELHRDDFSKIFGAQARWGRYIGGW